MIGINNEIEMIISLVIVFIGAAGYLLTDNKVNYISLSMKELDDTDSIIDRSGVKWVVAWMTSGIIVLVGLVNCIIIVCTT